MEFSLVGGGYRYQLTCHEAIGISTSTYSVSNPYGGILFIYATTMPWQTVVIDGVTVFDSTTNDSDIMHTYLRCKYGTTGSNYSYEIPYGQSISIIGTVGFKIVSYKYQKIAETS